MNEDVLLVKVEITLANLVSNLLNESVSEIRFTYKNRLAIISKTEITLEVNYGTLPELVEQAKRASCNIQLPKELQDPRKVSPKRINSVTSIIIGDEDLSHKEVVILLTQEIIDLLNKNYELTHKS